jgi:hypothetical protein
MGAWGEGPFDNDDAGDWSYEFDGLDEAAGLEVLVGALDVGPPDAYLEAPEGSIAVAAAVVVSWLSDPDHIPDSPYGESAAAWVRSAKPTPTASLTSAARAALGRVRADGSELAELWAEADPVAWQKALDQIDAQLRAEGPAT